MVLAELGLSFGSSIQALPAEKLLLFGQNKVLRITHEGETLRSEELGQGFSDHNAPTYGTYLDASGQLWYFNAQTYELT